MPEHIRSLIFILALSSMVFFLQHKVAAAVSGTAIYLRRRNLWIVLTVAAFLAHSFWIYAFLLVMFIAYAMRFEKNPPALYFFLLFVLPVATAQIPGMGVVNYIFDLSHARLLVLSIFVPIFFSGKLRSAEFSFGRAKADVVLLSFVILLVALSLFRESTFTNSMRYAFYLLIDIFIPYYVISRSLRNLEYFRDAIMSFVMATMVVALLAMFEFAKSWLLYMPVLNVLGLEGMTGYLARGDMLRANVTAGQAIALGFLMVCGTGMYLYLHRFAEKRWVYFAGLLIMLGGVIAPLSRGPWIGGAVMFAIFILTGPYAVRRITMLAAGAMLALSVVSMMPGGQKVINLLPFIGTTEKENVDYREQLITNSMIVIKRNLWLGSGDYLKTPEMEAMRQGGGIIDIVNSYIQVALYSGITGVTLFVGFFVLVLAGIWRGMRAIKDKNSEAYILGRILFAIQSAILLIIFTTSSITIIPIVYWAVAGMGVAYAKMVLSGAHVFNSTGLKAVSG